MATDWGTRHLNDYTPTLHHEPYAGIDARDVLLPRPYVVCVVGASRGIGAGVAVAYAQAGASGLVLAARRMEGLEATAARCREVSPLKSNGGEGELEVEVVECDITSAAAVEGLAARTRRRGGGRLDVVVVNSGFAGPLVRKVTEAEPEAVAQAVNVNYVGTFLCAKYLVPLLVETRDGARAFVAVSSLAVGIVRGPLANAQYCVSKAAQLKLIEHLHEQFSPEEEGGVSAFAVHPGGVRTEMAMEDAKSPEYVHFLNDSADLCGCFCVWLTKDREKKWLSGRFSSALWDVDELVSKKQAIVDGDALKLQVSE